MRFESCVFKEILWLHMSIAITIKLLLSSGEMSDFSGSDMDAETESTISAVSGPTDKKAPKDKKPRVMKRPAQACRSFFFEKENGIIHIVVESIYNIHVMVLRVYREYM